MSLCYGFKQRKNQSGELERVQEGPYPYYNRRPGLPMSPTIEPPSFFNKADTRRIRARSSFHPSLPPLREASSPVLEAAESMDDDLKLNDLMDLDPGKMRRGLRSMSRSVVHAQRLGRGRAS